MGRLSARDEERAHEVSGAIGEAVGSGAGRAGDDEACGRHGDRVRYAIERGRQRLGLTAREAEIVAELAAGRTNRDIADRLAIAPRTVEVHLSSMLRKAHADSRSQLVIDLWQLADDR